MRFDVPTVVAVGLLVAVGAGLAVGSATSAAAFGSFNPDWDGTSELRSVAESEGADAVVLRNATSYDDYGGGDVAFVLAPEASYDERERERVRRFVERGGTLVVADREGAHARELLSGVGAEARPVGPVLRDEREHYRGPALPVAANVSDHPQVENVSSLTLNHGTAVEPNGATVLVASSGYGYLDRDGSGSRSGDEAVRSYPVATVESVGDGRVVVVGDASVFINVMQGQAGNEAFTRALVGDADDVVVDVSTGSLPPLVAALLVVRESTLLQLLLGLGGLATVAVVGRLDGRTDRADPLDRLDETTLEAGLRRIHPSLDRERLRKVTKGVIRDRMDSRNDE